MSAYVACKQESNCVDTVHTQLSVGTAAINRQFTYYNTDSAGGPSYKENVRRPLAGTANQPPVLSSIQMLDDPTTFSDCRLTANSGSAKKRKSVVAAQPLSAGAVNDESAAAAASPYDPVTTAAGVGPPTTGPPRRVANARERDRTYSVNSAFVTLRTMIPTEPADRKLSKIETIRLATSYIAHLQTVLTVGLDEVDQPCMILRQRASGSSAAGEQDSSPAPLSPTHICTFCLSASKSKSQFGSGLSAAAAAGVSHPHHPSASVLSSVGPSASCMYHNYINAYV